MGLCYLVKLVKDQLQVSKRKDFFFPLGSKLLELAADVISRFRKA